MNTTYKCRIRAGFFAVLSVFSFDGVKAQSFLLADRAYPRALAVSQDEVFWTTSGSDGAEIRRISKFNADPNATGDLVFSQQPSTTVSLQSLLHAEVSGVPYIYFVTNKDSAGRIVSYINRVPAAGGQVNPIATPLPMGKNDLKTDGTFLYWADRERVRKVPMNGGQATILGSVENAAYVKQVAVDSQNVYFNGGLNGQILHSVPKLGGAKATQVVAVGRITDIDVYENGSQSTIYWGEANGSVKSMVVGSGDVIVHQEPCQYSISSVAFDGTRLIWSECPTDDGFSCQIRVIENGQKLNLLENGLVAANIVAEPDQFFWTHSSRISKYVHPDPLIVKINPSPLIGHGSTKPGVNEVFAWVQANVFGGEQDRIDEPYPKRIEWSLNDFFRISDPRLFRTKIYSWMPNGDSRDGTLQVRVTDRMGRVATAEASVVFDNPPDVDPLPGPGPLPQ